VYKDDKDVEIGAFRLRKTSSPCSKSDISDRLSKIDRDLAVRGKGIFNASDDEEDED
jgi:hypothetical protein